jgi:hypothetical protein
MGEAAAWRAYAVEAEKNADGLTDASRIARAARQAEADLKAFAAWASEQTAQGRPESASRAPEPRIIPEIPQIVVWNALPRARVGGASEQTAQGRPESASRAPKPRIIPEIPQIVVWNALPRARALGVHPSRRRRAGRKARRELPSLGLYPKSHKLWCGMLSLARALGVANSKRMGAPGADLLAAPAAERRMTAIEERNPHRARGNLG